MVKRYPPWLLLPITVLLMLLVLLFHPLGFRFLVCQVVHYIPGLTLTNIEGTLTRCSIEKCEYRSNAIAVTVADVSLQLDPFRSCKNGALTITSLRIKGLRVDMDTTLLTEPSIKKDDYLLNTPIPLQVKVLDLSMGEINLHGNKIAVDRILGEFEWKQHCISSKNSAVDRLHIQRDLSVDPVKPGSSHERILAWLRDLEAALVSKEKSALLEKPLRLKRLVPFDFIVEGLHGSNWLLPSSSSAPLIISTVRLEAYTIKNTLFFDACSLKLPEAEVQGAGNITYDTNLAINLKLQVSFSNLEQKLTGWVRGDRENLLEWYTETEGLVSGTVMGRVKLQDPEVPFYLNLNIPRFKWALANPHPFSLQAPALPELCDVNYTLSGRPSNYSVSGTTRFLLEGVASTILHINANGSFETVAINDSSVKLNGSSIHLYGTLAWGESLDGKLRLSFNGQPLPGFERFQMSPSLHGTAELKGSFFPGGQWNTSLSVPNLQLQLDEKGERIQLNGELVRDRSGAVQFSNITAVTTSNRLSLEGVIGQEWRLNGKGTCNDLHEITPQLRGTLRAEVNCLGERSSPAIALTLLGKQLEAPHRYRLGTVELKGKLKYETSWLGSLVLNAHHVRKGETDWALFSLQLKGKEANHSIAISGTHKDTSIQETMELRIAGKFDRSQQRWRGTVAHGILQNTQGTYTASDGIGLQFEVSDKRFSVSPHSWVSSTGAISIVRLSISPSELDGDCRFTTMTTHLLNPFIKRFNAKLDGYLSGRATLGWKKGVVLPKLLLRCIGHDLTLLIGDEVQHIPIAMREVEAKAELDGDRLNLSAALVADNQGSLVTEVTVTDLSQCQLLSGHLTAKDIDIRYISPLLIEPASQWITGKVHFKGTLKHPLIHGELSTGIQSILSVNTPCVIDKGDIYFLFSGEQCSVRGQLEQGSGKIVLRGTMTWESLAKWNAECFITGTGLALGWQPCLHLQVVPQLTIRLSPGQVDISGTLEVPNGQITVHELPKGAIKISDKEQLVDRNFNPLVSANKLPYQLTSNVELILGNHVFLNAFNIKGRLEGKIVLRYQNKGLGLYGQITTAPSPEAYFRMYGQNFTIERGALLFSGSFEQTLLELEAVKNQKTANSPDKKVGLRANGLLKSPVVTPFSDGAQEELNFSRDLLGYEEGKSGVGAIAGPLSYLFSGITDPLGNWLGNSVGSAFGLKQIEMGIVPVDEVQSFSVTGYFTDRIQLGYRLSLDEGTNTYLFRWQIIPKVYLQLTSGSYEEWGLFYEFH